MNVHHLELFYYVAKHHGITNAVRKMPYGIQQPAVSGQILQLEKELGVKLFNRRPFALTPAGEELFDYASPFFSRLHEVGSRLRGEEGRHLRLAASATVLNNHLPAVLEAMRNHYPDLRLTLREANPANIDSLLANQEADIAISALPPKAAPGVRTISLLRLPLILLVRDDHPATTFKKLCDLYLADHEITEPLIALPPNENVTKLFERGLMKKGIYWQPRVEVASLDIVPTYAAAGFGLGLTPDIPSVRLPEGIRKIPLPGFPPLVVGLLYTGKLKPVAHHFAQFAIEAAKKLGKASA